LGKGEVCFEPRKEGFKDWQDHVERKKGFLNQERKDETICRILTILVSFLSWFRKLETAKGA